jgi:hypothetical protein
VGCVQAAQLTDLPVLSPAQVEPAEESPGVYARMSPHRDVLDEISEILRPATAPGILKVDQSHLGPIPEPVGEVAVPVGIDRVQSLSAHWGRRGARAAHLAAWT